GCPRFQAAVGGGDIQTCGQGLILLPGRVGRLEAEVAPGVLLARILLSLVRVLATAGRRQLLDQQDDADHDPAPDDGRDQERDGQAPAVRTAPRQERRRRDGDARLRGEHERGVRRRVSGGGGGRGRRRGAPRRRRRPRQPGGETS